MFLLPFQFYISAITVVDNMDASLGIHHAVREGVQENVFATVMHEGVSRDKG